VNYRSLIGSAFAWISLDKAFWYLIFFWISLPFLVLLPQIFQLGVYSKQTLPIAFALYDILYATVILGVIVLIQFCLNEKKVHTSKITVLKIVDTVFLVFVELFYAFVWNIHSSFRIIQLLLIVASVLVYYYYLVMQNELLFLIAWLCLGAYFILVIYNAVRILFSTTIFCFEDMDLKSTVKASWALTHNRFYHVFTSLIFILALSFLLFSFLTIVLGTISTLVLSYFFIDSVSMSLGFRVAVVFALGPALIAYHSAFTDLFLQLKSHKASSENIRRILARKVLSHKKKAPARKLAKKKKR